jgi:hypothetical protein
MGQTIVIYFEGNAATDIRTRISRGISGWYEATAYYTDGSEERIVTPNYFRLLNPGPLPPRNY